MGGGAYVGRIGGLAVALGIGIAIVSGASQAAAEPSNSTNSSAGAAAPHSAQPVGTPRTSLTARVKAAPRLVPLGAPPRTTATATATRTTVDDTPIAPPDSPVALALAAASRRESVGSTQHSLAAAVTPVTAATLSPVVAIPQTPPLAFLQHVPVLGRVLVTPIVAFIHQIPMVSDLLHPLIGYPVQPGAPAGAPVPRDVKVVSFDGALIYVHFMPATGLRADVQAPTVLYGPGLPMPGQTNIGGSFLDGVLADSLGTPSILALRNAGYNVVTWDPRGEYNSTGQLEVDSPDHEARDVSAIISWVATQPEVQVDGDRANLDPRIGMVGGSYGGGIQLVTAAIDHRVDAIVPTIAWNSLNTSLYKAQSFKSGWGTILAAALLLTFARVNPRIIPAAISADLTGMLSQSDQDLLADRGPALPRDLIDEITAPTLLIQGTVDTLFSLQEADANAQELIGNGVPTKVLWFCGGHGLCTNNLFDASDGVLIEKRTIEWLDHYVKEDPTVSTGPQFEWVDQRGQHLSSVSYDVTPGAPVVASSTSPRTLPLVPFLGSGPLLFVLPIGATRAINSLNLTTPAATTTTYAVGAPQLTFTYTGQGIGNHVYAQLIDNSTGEVLGNQVTPIRVTLDGKEHSVSVPLEMVAQTLKPGQRVTLQLFSSSASYQTVGSVGTLTVSSMQLELPTVDPATVSVEPV